MLKRPTSLQLPAAAASARVPLLAVVTASVLTLVIFYMTDTLPRFVKSSIPISSSALPADTPVHQRAHKPLAQCAGATGTDRMGTQAKSFLMVFMSRSGSTAISQTMALHPLIEHKFEYMMTSKVGRNDSVRALSLTREFFKDAISRGKIPGFKIRAFDIMTDPAGWEALVREFDTRIIWQYRKNVFKTTLGVYARVVFNDYTATGGIKVTDLESKDGTADRCSMGVGCSFNITDFAQFHRLLTERVTQDLAMVQAVKVLDGNGARKCVFELPYEDYLYHKEETMTDLFAFLGLKLTSLETFRAKATADSMCDVVANFDELCEHFYACPHWQPFLDDFQNDCRCKHFSHGTDKYCSIPQLSGPA